jgi:tetratricopeptide (TPR) repeat protein/DNA-binding XRE family transcriptional regulator
MAIGTSKSQRPGEGLMSASHSPNLGKELRLLRTKRGLSQTKLAAEINFSRSYLCRVESGTKPLTLTMAEACDRVLASDLSAMVHERPARNSVRGGLPPTTPNFVGRAAELDQVVRILSAGTEDGSGAVVLCSITGMGGVGKTALALRAAHRVETGFPDGCLFIDLHGFDGQTAVEPADALYRLLTQLGEKPDDIPAHVEDRSALFRGQLSSRRLLLVLDNARDVEQVAPLIPSSSGCPALITSRDALDALDDVVRVPLEPLPPGNALGLLRSLFGERSNEHELLRIAEWSGYLPLALRIASATFAGAGAEELAERLSDVENRLGDFEQSGRSLTEVFEYSLTCLQPGLRSAFLLLGLHPGAEFELQAAAALIGCGLAAARRQLRSLCELSLLTPQGGRRYKFHDLLRLFAAEKAHTCLSAEHRLAALTRIVDYYLRSALAADQILAPDRFLSEPPDAGLVTSRVLRDYAEALAWAVSEQDNLAGACRAAYANGLDDRCWILAHTLRGYFFLTKTWAPWLETHELAAKAARRAGDRSAEAVALNNLGLAHMEQGDHETAGVLYRRASDLFTMVGDLHGVNTSLAHHSWVHFARGDYHEALRESLDALEFRRATGSSRKLAILLRDIARIEIALGRHESAIARLEEALPIFADVGSRIDSAMAYNCLGEAYLCLGRLSDARRVLQDAAAASRASGSSYELARALENLGHLALGESSVSRARTAWSTALGLYSALRLTGAEERVRRGLDSLPE